ncbi:hypothetical protein WJ977_05830 [Achromobacter xylosoxidans]
MRGLARQRHQVRIEVIPHHDAKDLPLLALVLGQVDLLRGQHSQRDAVMRLHLLAQQAVALRRRHRVQPLMQLVELPAQHWKATSCTIGLSSVPSPLSTNR